MNEGERTEAGPLKSSRRWKPIDQDRTTNAASCSQETASCALPSCSSFFFFLFFFSFSYWKLFPSWFSSNIFCPSSISHDYIAASGSRSTVLIKACEQKENKRKYKHENQPKWMRNGEQERSQHRCSIFWTATRIDCIYRWWTDLTRRRCGTKTLLFLFFERFPDTITKSISVRGFSSWNGFVTSFSEFHQLLFGVVSAFGVFEFILLFQFFLFCLTQFKQRKFSII